MKNNWQNSNPNETKLKVFIYSLFIHLVEKKIIFIYAFNLQQIDQLLSERAKMIELESKKDEVFVSNFGIS